MGRFVDHLTYANVMATLAVFIALGGVSYAAVALPKNSVGQSQLKANAVTGAKIKNGSVGRPDLAPGLLKAGATGPQGETGPAGTAGADGKTGATGAAGAKGDTGLQGVQGLQGIQGLQGTTGPPGPSTGPAGGALTGTFPNPTLANGSVGIAALATGAVTTGKLGDASVTNTKLADDTVTSTKVAADALTGADIDESTLVGVLKGGSRTVLFDTTIGTSASSSTHAAGTPVEGRLELRCLNGTTTEHKFLNVAWVNRATTAQDSIITYVPGGAATEGADSPAVVHRSKLLAALNDSVAVQSSAGAGNLLDDQSRRFEISVLAPTGERLTLDIHGVSRAGGTTNCTASVTTQLG